ncbi:hypothetical protein ACQ4WX_28560 [Streptomyces lasalocidi]|nr:hypothetical protein [Streptomyces sp. MUSC 14]
MLPMQAKAYVAIDYRTVTVLDARVRKKPALVPGDRAATMGG